MIKDNKFETDFQMELFSIHIIVCDGGIKTGIQVLAEDRNPTFHEVIGALEYLKMHLIENQREQNKKNLEKDEPETDEKK